MPLLKFCDMKSFKQNMQIELDTGKPVEQCAAIAYSTLKAACGVKSKERMTPSEIIAAGNGTSEQVAEAKKQKRKKGKKGKVEISSVLEKIVHDVERMNDVGRAKDFVIAYLMTTKIKEQDKRKMMYSFEKQMSMLALVKLMYNLILKYKGHGVAKARREDVSDVSDVSDLANELKGLLDKSEDIGEVRKLSDELRDLIREG